MGAAQIFTILFGMIRVKLVAVLLGTEGIGILGNYQSVTTIASSLASMGAGTSGVLQVAQNQADANTKSDVDSRTALLCFSWLTGLTGCLSFYLLTPQISQFTFGTTEHSDQLSALAITILFSNVAIYQTALIQGRRQIGDLAKVIVLSSFISTIASAVLISIQGVNGIVPSLLVASICPCVVAMRYTGKFDIKRSNLSICELLKRLKDLLRLGIFLVWSGFLTAFVAYGTRVLITRNLGLDSVGIYTAALSLSTIFVQFILNAMGNDFYPRLTANATDHQTMCRLINEQTEVGVLLAFPCLIGTFVYSPQIVALFYADEFAPSVSVLRWLILGNLGRVISWPMGFSTLAKGQTFLFVVLETIFNILNILFAYAGLVYGGLIGIALSFVVLYVVHTFTLIAICKRTIGFSWNRNVKTQLIWMLPTTAATYISSVFTEPKHFLIIGSLVTLLSGCVCLWIIAHRANLWSNSAARKLLLLFRRFVPIDSCNGADKLVNPIKQPGVLDD